MPDPTEPTADRPLFQPVQRTSTLAERVTTEIQEVIVNRRLQAGDRLPSERELAGQLGVSRTVVRDAIRSLIAKGLLEARPGSGTVVCGPSARSVVQSMALFLSCGSHRVTVENLVEIRRVLEVAMAGLAAERRTPEDLAQMRDAVSRHSKAVEAGDLDQCVGADWSFHVALARATHNELFRLLLDSIADILIEIRRTAQQVPGRPRLALGYHRAILRQVKAANVEQARQTMHLHLGELERTMRKVAEMRAGPGSESSPRPKGGPRSLSAGPDHSDSGSRRVTKS
jgi:GntR family transcriptional repressor for pyruvate dehydrogenase complex